MAGDHRTELDVPAVLSHPVEAGSRLMVQERSPQSAWLLEARATLESIANAFRKHLAESAALDTATPAVRELTRIARANDVAAEHVVIELKRSLEEHEHVHRTPGAARLARERLIGIAIRSYYVSDSSR